MELEQTADGSYTLYVPELDEHYHSVKGALTESQHIFIEMGLKHSPVAEPRILEIGLGTGLNAFLTLLTAEEIRKKQDRPLYPVMTLSILMRLHPKSSRKCGNSLYSTLYMKY